MAEPKTDPKPATAKQRSFFDLSTAVVACLVALGVFVVFRREGFGGVTRIFFDDLWLFVDILPKVLAGCLIGAFVALVAPRETVARWIGSDSGLLGLVIATAMGIVTPGGPFTIYPLAGALIVAGAGVGPAVAFVTSWTLLGYYRAIVWEAAFFGVDFLVVRLIVSVPMPFIAGVLAARLDRFLCGSGGRA